MQNTYQEKIGDLEANSAPVRKKLEGGIKFRIKSSFKPAGDQPGAIKKILQNLKEKKRASFVGCDWFGQNLYNGKSNRICK